MAFVSINSLAKTFPHAVRFTSSSSRHLNNSLAKLSGSTNFLLRINTSSSATTTSTFCRYFSFSWSGKKLDDIVKLDLLQRKNKEEVELIWEEYHKGLSHTVGVVLSGDDGTKVLMRAQECSFFIQPIFREGGFFTLVSQFQSPSYFLLAYLEDYKTNASTSQPLITLSVYNELASNKNVTLIRGEIINKGIQQEEGEKVIHQLIEAYRDDDEFDIHVRTFNKNPTKFNYNDFMEKQRVKWNDFNKKIN